MTQGEVSMRAPAVARVAVVIVTYNSADVLGECLHALADEGTPLTAVVVADNASRDETCGVAERFADLDVTVVRTGRNGGYAAGVNAGIKALDLSLLDAILVLNADCRVSPNTLQVLASTLSRPHCGIAVPRLRYPNGAQQYTLRRTPTVVRALVEALVPGQVAGRLGPLAERVTDPRAYEQPGVTAWATGAAMMLSTRTLLDVGLWDESFLMYSEETEYCLRAADRGWSTWYEPAAVFEHVGGDSETKPTFASMLTVNKVELFRRRHNRLHGAAYLAAVAVGQGIRAAVGRPTSRASVVALFRPSRRLQELPT